MSISRKYPTRTVTYDPPRIMGDVPHDPRLIADLPPCQMPDPEKQAVVEMAERGEITWHELDRRLDDIDQARVNRAYLLRHPQPPVSAINTRRARYERIVVVVLVLLVAAALITILAK